MKLLNSTREKAIRKMIIDKFPEPLKLDFAWWTRKAVKELIEQQYSIYIAMRTVGTYLKNWRFTPQKPKKKAHEQDGKKVQKGVLKNKENLALFYSPSYSPERNPDEYLHGHLKQWLSVKTSPKTKEKPQENIQKNKEILETKPDRIMKYFKHQCIK